MGLWDPWNDNFDFIKKFKKQRNNVYNYVFTLNSTIGANTHWISNICGIWMQVDLPIV